MRNLGRHVLFGGGVAVGSLLLHWFFVKVVGMPIGSLIVLALVVTWLAPRPWRLLGPLAVLGEVVAITPPLAVTLTLMSPLLIFWLRGRIQPDISFSYLVLVAASAALALALIVGITVYPVWLSIPWPTVLVAWLSITLAAAGGSLLLPALHGRFLHGRYF